MQLSDIREKYTIREISYQTKISEDNLNKLFDKEFENLKKVKAFGFISILEREYKSDLVELREEANQYYMQFGYEKSGILKVSVSDEKKGNSTLFRLMILVLLGYASWYFLTQFDKKHLSGMIPFIDEATFAKLVPNSDNKKKDSDTIAITETTEKKEIQNEATQTEVETIVTPIVEKIDSKNIEEKKNTTETNEKVSSRELVSIVPLNRLWFGLIDLGSKKRDHFSVANTFELDVSNKSWLVATSSASFSLKFSKEEKQFNDNQEHYFKIDKEGIKVLTKDAYVSLGGWEQW